MVCIIFHSAPPFTLTKKLLAEAHFLTDGTHVVIAAPDAKSTLCRVFSLEVRSSRSNVARFGSAPAC